MGEKLNKLHNLLEEFQNVRYRIDKEGFHYCFRHYSSFDEVEDDKFHKLREEYFRVSKELENYVEKKISDLENEISDLENKYDPIIDDAYKNYGKRMTDIMNVLIPAEFMNKGWVKLTSQGKYDVLSQEEFINKIKTDDEFAKKWGLKIEERELSYDQRFEIFILKNERKFDWTPDKKITSEVLDELNIPTRVITLTYNNETIECYE